MAIEHCDTTPDAVAYALAVITQRIQSLPKADRSDLRELFVEFAAAWSEDDAVRVESARRAIQELLNSVRTTTRVMEVPDGTDKLRNWAEFYGKTISRLRAEAGLTQTQLAEKSGIAQSYISRLENAEHTPNALTLEKLAKALSVPVAKLDPNAPDEITEE